jgi:EAL domain-containing protein (putative c-di-GMP-specific phosphodiesterase class I)
LDKAIENRWSQPYYQPIVRAVNGRVCDEEALARWIDPERGFLSPADFIPYLEDAGVIYKLDLCILEQVLEKMERLKAAGLYLVPQSINLSRSDFYACDIVEEIRRRVDDAGIERKKITIEITESTIGGDFDYIKEQIERFRALGFPVWMDDFGSGYSSLDVLQSVEFDLIKFDMSFMKRLDEGEKAKIILSELMKMATALGVDTVCEGVETQEQVRFLQEIGCSKLQGYYFCKPIPLQQILERYKTGVQIGFENPKESGYFESMGRINLHDLAAIASEDSHVLKDFFNTLPVGIVEVIGDSVQFVRSNQTYRDFLERFFDVDLSKQPGNPQEDVHPTHGLGFLEFVKSCCRGEKSRGFLEERMPDGSVVGSFIRKIGTNPVTGKTAFAAAVLSVKKGDRGATYAGIARALAADYHSLYYVDLSTEQYIEYSSPVGGEQLAEEAHGEKFFDVVRSEAYERLYPADVEGFLTEFNRENILFELGRQGVFSTAYRLMKEGKPVYASMKVMRMDQQGDHLIIGVSIIDAQMKKREEANLLRKERDVAERIMALTGDYLSLYTVDTETGHYFQFSASDEYERLGFAKRGEDFFHQGLLDGRRMVAPEDLPLYEERFNRETVLKEIREKGIYQLHYRLMMDGKPIHVSLRMAAVKESNGDKLVAGVRAWKTRK